MACARHRRVRRSFAPKNCSLRSHFFGDPGFAPPQPSTRPAKDNQNNTGKLNQQGSRKRFATQRFFGKRRRNGAKRAGCFGKPLKSEVYGDEKARRRGAVPAEPLRRRLPLLPPRKAFFLLISISSFKFSLRFSSSHLAHMVSAFEIKACPFASDDQIYLLMIEFIF